MLKLKSDFKSRREIFPDPTASLEAGIVAVGIQASVETLYEAYSFGLFPWPHENLPLLWFCPEERGVLNFQRFHIPRRLHRELRKHTFEFSWNENFEEVIRGCQNMVRSKEQGTWITEELIQAYVEFHKEGYAHSLEVRLKGELVGGLYGVCVGGVFSAESMFFQVSPASKAALIFCVDSLKSQGLSWMDMQMVSSVSRQFGAEYISRNNFLKRLPSFQITSQKS